jgi:uncharacterized membrane protein
MDIFGFFPLLLLLLFFAPFIVIGVLINLYNRVGRLESMVQQLSNGKVLPREQAPMQRVEESVPQPVPAQVAPQPAPLTEDRFVSWLKDNWLLKLGALLLLIGLGWFVSYAFLNNWIGPMGRITLGLFAGTSVLALGFWRMRAYITQGSVFVILGATTILLTIYAARSIYDFFTPQSALGLMFAASALVALASGVYNRRQLAVASVLMAGIAPMFTHASTTDFVGLFWYLLVVIVGAIWLVFWRDYREVVTAALVVVALYSAPLLMKLQSADLSTLLLFSYAFAAIFYISHTSGILRLKKDAVFTDMITAVFNAMFLVSWIYIAADPQWQSLIISVWALVFVIGAFVVFRASGRREAVMLYSAIAVGYIAAATAIQLHGAVLVIAFIFEAAAVSLTLYILSRNIASAQRASLLLLVPGLLSLPSITASEWNTTIFNEHFFVLAIFALTLFGLGGMFRADARASTIPEVRKGNAWLFILGSAYAYVLLWLALHAAMPQSPDTATMAALIVYTIAGIATYLYGIEKESRVMRLYGGILLALVVGRLLIVDVWQMELTGRIITFCLIGTLLMSTAFLGRKKKGAV